LLPLLCIVVIERYRVDDVVVVFVVVIVALCSVVVCMAPFCSRVVSLLCVGKAVDNGCGSCGWCVPYPFVFAKWNLTLWLGSAL
jgi:hypothetical protein